MACKLLNTILTMNTKWHSKIDIKNKENDKGVSRASNKHATNV